ncbi:cytochrome c oxidase subunit 3 [Chromobacterium aquaticum]|uniref:Cytochrome c oxidase subunit 3 n=1 Tax=Chromobacterium aquaticum TaxID=467180 RepID=A0ABV8ZPK9_9NEIS|nr:cytochrome c oxidase subunit 3 [Chromobacterium aquaticum]MCD5364150.1 cytochrome c oxidase subunit 3 [Chromobacterium aquaticum]
MELSAPQQRRVPGDLAMWCFILAELAVFGVFFLAYAWARRQQPALFAAGQGGLELGLPTLNTLLLLAGSAAILAALSAFSAGRQRAGRRWLALTLLAGGGFLALKGYELVGKAVQGITLSSNEFWMFYLSLTVFHFLHVVLGMVIVAAVWWLARDGRYQPGAMDEVETAAAYWHMVDLVWLLLFALVYVAR